MRGRGARRIDPTWSVISAAPSRTQSHPVAPRQYVKKQINVQVQGTYPGSRSTRGTSAATALHSPESSKTRDAEASRASRASWRRILAFTNIQESNQAGIQGVLGSYWKLRSRFFAFSNRLSRSRFSFPGLTQCPKKKLFRINSHPQVRIFIDGMVWGCSRLAVGASYGYDP